MNASETSTVELILNESQESEACWLLGTIRVWQRATADRTGNAFGLTD